MEENNSDRRHCRRRGGHFIDSFIKSLLKLTVFLQNRDSNVFVFNINGWWMMATDQTARGILIPELLFVQIRLYYFLNTNYVHLLLETDSILHLNFSKPILLYATWKKY